MLWRRSSPEEINQLNGWLRRAAHTGVYLILTVLVLSTVVVGGGGQGANRRELLIALIALLLWSVIDEATKVLIPGRHFSWFDVGLNMAGVLIGALIVMAVVLMEK